jgi:hypothetical protein
MLAAFHEGHESTGVEDPVTATAIGEPMRYGAGTTVTQC